jgi:hypothetical protein
VFIIDDIFKSIANKKRAKEATRAGMETEKRQREFQAASEAQRGARLGGANRFLQGFKASSGQYGTGGYTPATHQGYALDPETMAAIQKPLPYAGPAVADQSKGAGWDMLGDIFKGAGQGLLTAYMGGAFGGKGGEMAGPATSDIQTGFGDFIPSTGYNFNKLLPRF